MTCVGVEEDPEPLAEVKSPEFGTDAPGELLRVGSTVEVGADAERAMRELRLVRSRRAERCLQRVYASAIKEEESSTAEVSDVSVSRARFPAPDIEHGFAASVTVHRDLRADRLPAPGRIEPFADGEGLCRHPRLRRRPRLGQPHPASVSLTATGVPAPAGKTLEQNLLRVLHERASELRP